MPFHAACRNAVDRVRPLLDAGADLLDVGLRVYVARVFILSGLVKLRGFGSTRALFADEYRVPLLHGSRRLALDAWRGRRGPMAATHPFSA